MASPRAMRLLCAASLMLHAFTAHAQEAAATPAPSTDTGNICTLPVSRLVFSLADLSKQNCGNDAQCSSLCWCRSWSSTPVTSTTLALCVPMNATSTCVSDAQRDCRTALTSASPASNSSNHAMTDDGPSSATKGSGISTGTSMVIALLCVGIIGGLAFAANWYRNRPPPATSAPATVPAGVHSGPLTWTELDSYDSKLPAPLSSGRPTHRGSISSQVPMQIDQNASMISGVTGTSYHDLDGTRLGHMNEAHALTDTELSLSQDATGRVFSPASAGGRSPMSRGGAQPASFLSTDSVEIVGLGHGQHGLQHGGHTDSSFISVASTTYLTNNDTFSSQITMPESDNGSMVGSLSASASTPRREVEF